MEKLNLHSPDFTKANIEKLAELFPNCVTETRAANGTLKKAIDFDLLKQELSTSIVEGPQERYQLNWPGKREALLTANAPIAKTLKPCREESVDFDTTQNLYIEGDNLDALKLLQETYLGKVKMIYIDPPYNTGKEFIYDDDFSEDTTSYFQRSNQKDETGQRMVANTETNGRFHSDWLSMMYPRLKLARNLLRDDGLIFISIDEGEQANLKRICDEIFGDDNSLESIIWKKRYQGAKEKHLIGVHEYILVYAKLKNNIGDINVPCTQEHIDKYYTNKDENFNSRGGYRTQPLEAGKSMDVRGNLRFTFQAPDGQIISPKRQWIWSQERVESAMALGEIGFTKGNQGELTPYIKQYLKDRNGVIRKTKKQTIIANVYTQNGTKEMDTIFNNTGVFSFPKPTNLLTQLIEISDDNTEQIILDFFSGSATSAHAVMKINAEDGGNRKFIMVQLPEVCAVTSEAYKEGYKTIAEIGKERIRRAGNKLKTDNLPDLDIGFRVLKVDSSNMKDVYYTPDKLMQGDLEQFTDNIRDDSTPEDLLFQVLLDWGVDLTLPITQEIIAGFNVLFVDDNALAACFDTDINEAFVKELAARHPMRVVFRDAGFASDSVKINIEQIFKLISPATEIKTL